MCPHGLRRGHHHDVEGRCDAMLARWSMPFCSGDGRQAGLLYLAAGYRDTTVGQNRPTFGIAKLYASTYRLTSTIYKLRDIARSAVTRMLDTYTDVQIECTGSLSFGEATRLASLSRETADAARGGITHGDTALL